VDENQLLSFLSGSCYRVTRSSNQGRPRHSHRARHIVTYRDFTMMEFSLGPSPSFQHLIPAPASPRLITYSEEKQGRPSAKKNIGHKSISDLRQCWSEDTVCVTTSLARLGQASGDHQYLSIISNLSSLSFVHLHWDLAQHYFYRLE
jgi:hypothetical protein